MKHYVTHSIRLASKWWCSGMFWHRRFSSEGWLNWTNLREYFPVKLESIQRMSFLAGVFWDTAIWSNRFWNHTAISWLHVAIDPLSKGWLVNFPQKKGIPMNLLTSVKPVFHKNEEVRDPFVIDSRQMLFWLCEDLATAFGFATFNYDSFKGKQ